MKELIEFLITAKKNTYANGKALRVEPSRQGSKDYHYEGEIDCKKAIYHDTYFGSKSFIGEEVVYIDSQKPIWGMNYYSHCLNQELYDDAMKVLRSALMLVGEDNSVLPLRGPSHYQSGDFTYTFESSGSLKHFAGIEKIFKNDQLIYSLNCQGGEIN